MPATVVVGTQWGDEGKGKFTDLFARDQHLVVRSQGGGAGRFTYGPAQCAGSFAVWLRSIAAARSALARPGLGGTLSRV